MKKFIPGNSIQYIILFAAAFFCWQTGNAQSTVTITLDWNGAQAQGCCDLCGNDYWCVNNTGGCGGSSATDSQNFTDPVPAGNTITGVSFTYAGTSCSANIIDSYVNSEFVGQTSGNGNCTCGGCDTYSGSQTFSCGIPGYNYGGTNSFTVAPDDAFCFDRVSVTFTYESTSNIVPNTPGPISGPTSVCQGDVDTYSISPVSGATSYTWTVPSGWSINSGQGTTSISATAGSSGGNICVTASNSCGTSSASCLSVSVSNPPPTPGSITGPSSVCDGASETYSISSVSGATSYNWMVPSGWTITSGGTTTSMTVTVGSSSGNVCVTASNSCGTSGSSCMSVNVNTAPAQPGPISGNTNVCDGASETYSISSVSGATSYTWTLPSGWSGSSTSTSITATVGSSGGNICVTANNSCGSSPAECLSVSVTSVPPTPGAISGPTTVCDGDNVTYSTTGSGTMNWTVPSGWSITSGQGTTSITATAGSSGGNVCVEASNSCGTSSPSCLSVSIGSAPAAPGPISGNTTVCESVSETYSVPFNSGTTYTWYEPSGWTITGGQGTDVITVTPGPSGGNLCVEATTSCGTSSQTCESITVQPPPGALGAVTGVNDVCENATETYSTSGASGATNYTWTVPSGATINSGQGSTTISVTFGNSSGNVCVEAENLCGTSGPECLFVNVSPFTVGGVVLSDDTVCEGSNSGSLTLSGHTGSILKWQSSADGGSTWSDISNTSTTQSYSNLTDTTIYHAIVQSGVCSPDTSASAEIVVLPATNGGTLLDDATYCSTTNGDTLQVVSFSGTIENWESSIDNGATWDSIGNTDDTLIYTNITQTTLYRVVLSGAGGGTCPDNVSSIATITINSATDGGDLIGDTTVCSGINTGVLNLINYNGTILNWELSTDSSNWFVLSNNADSLVFNNLTTTTWYKVLVQNANCALEYSTPAKVTVDEVSDGGTVVSSTTVCSGSNGATLNLLGFNGNILNWLSSVDGGVTWTNIANTTTSETYSNLTITTQYSAVVENGVCPADTGNAATITVDPAVNGGTIQQDDTVCSGNNSDTLVLSGFSGSVTGWELSTDGGATWVNVSNTTTEQIYKDLLVTTMYRVVVSSGECGTAYSDTAQITVIPNSDGGSISGGGITVCADTNSGTLYLNGYTGDVLEWQFTTNGGSTWNPVANTTDSLNYVNLTTSTGYRAVVQNGSCNADTSSTVFITVNPETVGGTVLDNDTVCSGSNGTLTLINNVGSVLNWEVSTDGGATWTMLSNNADTLNYVNITQTSMYRARVQSGSACSDAYSSVAKITVIEPSDGGDIEFGSLVCSGDNGDTLSLVGYNGTILYWQYSTNNGNSWSTVMNNTDTLTYNDLYTTTQYRVFVKNDICPADSSTVAQITVDDSTVAGVLSSDATVCSGMNNDTIFLNGYTGTIQGWESSTDGGITWGNISNTTNFQLYNNITTTTQYRVRVKNGVCPERFSNIVTITVDPMSDAGSLGSSANVCELGNGDTLQLTGYTGDIINWLYSGDGGNTWIEVYDTNVVGGISFPDTLSYTDLDSTVYYITVVQNGVCPPDTSDPAIINVSPESVGGTILSDDTVCSGINNGLLTLTGETGSIISWQVSTNGVNWISQSNTNNTNTFNYNNLTQTTYYRVEVMSGVCPTTFSDTATITVQQPGDPGTLVGDNILCGTLDPDTLEVEGYSGAIVGWLSSIDEGANWDSIANTDDTLVISGIDQNIWYQAIVQAGVCPPDTTNIAKLILSSKDLLTANDDETWIKGGQNASVNIVENDTGSWDVLTLVSSGNHGLASNNNDGSISYIPNQNYLGLDSVQYEICESVCGVCDSATVLFEVGVFVPTGFSPDGDGINDFFVITGIENYPDNKIVIFNRWGDMVFKAGPYKNDWNGSSENAAMKVSGDKVIEGTYFYILELGPGEEKIPGYVELRRGN